MKIKPFSLLALLVAASSAHAGITEIRSAIQLRIDSYLLRGVAVGLIEGNTIKTLMMGDVKKESDLFEAGSISKSAAGIITAQLSDEGKLDLDAPISKYIPELAGTFVGTVTATLLAQHKAQIVSTIYDQNGEEVYNYDEKTLLKFLKSYRPNITEYPPGVSQYSNTGFATLGLLISRIDGRSYPQSVRERIFKPLKMQDSTFIPTSGPPVPGLLPGFGILLDKGYYFSLGVFEAASGGIISSIADMKKYLKANLFPDSSPLQAAMVKSQKLGLGWDSEPGELPIHKNGAMSAGYATLIQFDPSQKIGAVILTNTVNTYMVDQLGKVAMGAADPLPQQRLTDDLLAKYVGVYQSGQLTAEVFVFHERFVGLRLSEGKNASVSGRLTLRSTDQFVFKADGIVPSPVQIDGNQLIYHEFKRYNERGEPVFEKHTFKKQ